jgi:hypothetical protein
MATATRKTTATREVPKSKGGVAKTRLSHAEARIALESGLAIELLVRNEDDAPEAAPTSYWLAIEHGAFRVVKIEDEEGATVYRLPSHQGRPTGCNCPDAKYRGVARPCRHVRLVGNVLTKLGLLS